MFILVAIRVKSALRGIFVLKPQNLIRLSSYVFVICLFLSLGGILFFKLFQYLETVEIIGPILEERIISLAFLIFLTMIFLSSLITGLSTFFRSEEIEYLMTTPLSIERIFLSKLFENSFYCSWATVIAAVPLMWALGFSHQYPFLFYPLSLAALVPFILIPSTIGVIVLILLVNVMGNVTKRHLGYIIILAIALLFVVLFITKPSMLRVPFTADINEVNAYVETLKVKNNFLPSDFLVKFLCKPFTRTSVLYLFLIFSSALFTTTLSYGVASRFYRRGWNNSFEAISSGYKRLFSNRLFNFLQKIKINQRVSSMIVKDIRMFIRLPSQWGQALILIVLLLTYIISLKRTPYYFNAPFWLAVISFINLGFTGYIIATLSTRFVYPAISLEGKSVGFLFSSPIRLKEFFYEKFIVSFIPNWVLAEVVVIASNIFLKSSPTFILICAVVTTVYTLTVISISIGFGAIFPDFTETNPSKIAAGGGGVITAILSLFYIVISTVIIAIPTRRFIESQIQVQVFHLQGFTFYVILFIIISFLFSIFPLGTGIKRLRRMEV